MRQPLLAKPAPEATYERARRLANMAMWTVALQCRRIRSDEPEDSQFVPRRWADFEFLIVALVRLRRAALIVLAAPSAAQCIREAIAAFDLSLPGLKHQRDIAEHIDEYALDSEKRHDLSVERNVLEVGILGDDHFSWLGHTLSTTTALSAAEALFGSVQSASRFFTKHD